MNKNEFKKYFIDGIKKSDLINSIELNDEKLEQFYKYSELLLDYNQKVNLTSITTPDGVIEKHFIESLLSYPYLLNKKNIKIIDVGTGAGFPGIPIKIFFPEYPVTLVESVKKKVVFLEYIKQELGLEDLEIFADRAEELAHYEEYREQYDFVFARAVSQLPLLSEICLPFLKVDGKAIFFKGLEISEEIANSRIALDRLNGKIVSIDPYTLPYSLKQGNLVIIKKNRPCSATYPRNGNKLGKF